MNDRDPRRPAGNFPQLPSLIEPTPATTSHETPRTYTTSPTIVQSSHDNALQLFQVFPETYNYSAAYSPLPSPAAPQHTQYLQPPELLYASPAPSSSPGSLHLPSPQFDGRYSPLNGYFPYDQSRHYNDEDRNSKRARLTPFSEYDSSSSDGECARSVGSMSDYPRSPQLPMYSQANSARTSPIMGGYSPVMGPTHAPRPRSNSYNTHLTAGFPNGVRKVRKNRRKLAPLEREQVHQLRKMGACTRCWGLKMKCDNGNPCHRCEKLGAGALCVRVHFVDLDVFSRWLADSYSKSMMHHVLKWTNTPGRTITISHDSNFGVTMPLNVYEFIPTDENQTQYWYRDYTSGWRSAHSVPYGLKRALSTDVLEKYIQDHTQHFIQTAFPGNPILSDLFTTAYNYSRADDHFLLRETLQMWTANQLLIQGASIHPGSDTLNLLPITGNTPLNGHVPLPRVVSDQFDHLIERRIWQLEKQILAELQKRIFARKKEDWLKIFLTLIVLMNTLERDSWRLYYWMFHLNDGCTWPHAVTPKELLQKDEMLAESLAAHFTAISKGITPFSLDWTREQTAALVGNIEGADAIVAAFERVGRGLRNPDHALHVTNVLSNYHAADEKSLDFLYTSKVMMV